jgi:hypothetical protein
MAARRASRIIVIGVVATRAIADAAAVDLPNSRRMNRLAESALL